MSVKMIVDMAGPRDWIILSGASFGCSLTFIVDRFWKVTYDSDLYWNHAKPGGYPKKWKDCLSPKSCLAYPKAGPGSKRKWFLTTSSYIRETSDFRVGWKLRETDRFYSIYIFTYHQDPGASQTRLGTWTILLCLRQFQAQHMIPQEVGVICDPPESVHNNAQTATKTSSG